MASITLTGTLLDPTGEVAVGDQIRFTHRTTTGETIQFARSVLIIPPNGLYNITLEFGLIFVEYLDVKDVHYKNLGVVTVNGDTTATDLPGLLNAIVPPTDAQLLLFQGILADTEDARDIALLAAAQQTTLELIASTTTHPNSTVLTLSGHTLPGDGGGGKWQLNGVVGQTPSQSPTDLADFLLNDGNGNQWALVDGVVLAFNAVQYLPLPFGATGNGNYAYNNNDFDKIVDPDRLNPSTLEDWKNDTSAQLGDVVHVAGRLTADDGAGFLAKVISGTGTANTFNKNAHNTLDLTLVAEQFGNIINPSVYGVISNSNGTSGNGNDDTSAWSQSIADALSLDFDLIGPSGRSRITSTLNMTRLRAYFNGSFVKDFDDDGIDIIDGGSVFTELDKPVIIATGTQSSGSKGINVRDSRVKIVKGESHGHGGNGYYHEDNGGNNNHCEIEMLATGNGDKGVTDEYNIHIAEGVGVGAGLNTNNWKIDFQTFGGDGQGAGKGGGILIEVEGKDWVGRIRGEDSKLDNFKVTKGRRMEFTAYLENSVSGNDYDIGDDTQFITLRGRLGSGTTNNNQLYRLTNGGNDIQVKTTTPTIERVVGTGLTNSASSIATREYIGSSSETFFKENYQANGDCGFQSIDRADSVTVKAVFGLDASQGSFFYGNANNIAKLYTGSGSPEGVVTAVRPSIFIRDDGGGNTSFYVKESGTGNTGWAAK